MEMKQPKYHWIAFWICLGISILLLVGGAIVPPPFVIDASIFKAVGWLFAFAALSQVPAVIEAGKTARISRGDTSVVIGENADDDDSQIEDEE